MRKKKILIISSLVILCICIVLCLKFIFFNTLIDLVYKSGSYTLDVPFNDNFLEKIEKDDVNNILNFFAKSSNWKVEHLIFRSKCLRKNNKGSIIARKKNTDLCHKLALFQFSESESIDDEFQLVKHKNKNTLIFNVNEYSKLLFNESKSYSINSILRGNNFSIIIFINSASKPVSGDIIEELEEISKMINNFVDFKKNDFKDIYINDFAPNSIKYTDRNEINIIHNDFNSIKISGYANTQKPGSVYLKVIDTETNESRTNIDFYNEEFIGWSNNDSIKYYFELDYQPVRGVVGKEYTVDCEVWFSPLDNTKDFLLIDKQIKILCTQPRGGWQ